LAAGGGKITLKIPATVLEKLPDETKTKLGKDNGSVAMPYGMTLGTYPC
jgi:hypothetical protein